MEEVQSLINILKASYGRYVENRLGCRRSWEIIRNQLSLVRWEKTVTWTEMGNMDILRKHSWLIEYEKIGFLAWATWLKIVPVSILVILDTLNEYN